MGSSTQPQFVMSDESLIGISFFICSIPFILTLSVSTSFGPFPTLYVASTSASFSQYFTIKKLE
jgi:hypothetical protein